MALPDRTHPHLLMGAEKTRLDIFFGKYILARPDHKSDGRRKSPMGAVNRPCKRELAPRGLTASFKTDP